MSILGVTYLLLALLRQVLIHSHSLRLLGDRLSGSHNRRLWRNGRYNGRRLRNLRLLGLVNLNLYLVAIIFCGLRLTVYDCVCNRFLYATTLLLNAITDTIYYAAEVMVDKYTCQNPARNNHQQSSEASQQIRQILCAGLSKFSANIISYAPLVGNQTHSQRAYNKQQRGTQRKVVEMQRLLTEDTPAENSDNNRDNYTKDTERAIYHPIGNRSANAATYVLELYGHTRKFGIVTQSREV